MSTTLLQIAEVCHEANRAFCRVNGDNSQKSWEEAEQWQRDSAVKGVQFRLQNPTAPASAQHEAWLEDKRANGWTYGPTKSAENKTHPCFLPYDGLPAEQQAKDVLFIGIVDALKS